MNLLVRNKAKTFQQVLMTWYSGFAYTMFHALDNLQPSQCRLTNSCEEICQNLQQQTESKHHKLEIFLETFLTEISQHSLFTVHSGLWQNTLNSLFKLTSKRIFGISTLMQLNLNNSLRRMAKCWILCQQQVNQPQEHRSVMKLEERGGRADDLGWWRILTETNKKNLPSWASCIKGSNIQCPTTSWHTPNPFYFHQWNFTAKYQVSGRWFLLSNRKFFLKLDLVTMRVIFNNKGKVCRHKVGSDARQMLPKLTEVQQVSKGKRRHLKYPFSTNWNPVLVRDRCSCKFSQFKADSGWFKYQLAENWFAFPQPELVSATS